MLALHVLDLHSDICLRVNSTGDYFPSPAFGVLFSYHECKDSRSDSDTN